ncbi:RDD family protein [Candidatus Phyllobacterium onerii]|uniref:RDD family protein n=1 Tax=Candidatus Phyllobacterium onerii TaxID=3020828 RepID=UPI00232E29B5|nr:RDD family protein [Phyllobacterium sp. IY22]
MNTKTLDGEIITNRLDDWRLYQGVRTSRIFAFLIDYVIVFFLCIPVAILIAIIGVATLGLGWILYGIMFPVVALAYIATTLGGPRQATKGMQMMGLKLERLDGQKVDSLLAVVHTVLFWGLNVVLTPLILLATLFLDRKRTVHDLLLGTVVVRAYN